MSDIDLVKKVRVYAEEAEKNGFEVLTVPLRDLFPLLGRMEAAERERDELRVLTEQDGRVITNLNEVVNGLYDRIHKVEAELARSDAAAGERAGVVTGYAVNGCVVSGNKLSIGDHVYTAASPAVLRDIEPLIEGALKLHGLLTAVDGHSQLSDGFRNGARWAAKELGAQQQKVVQLPETHWTFDDDQNPTFDADKIIAALDAANVKWEVKK